MITRISSFNTKPYISNVKFGSLSSTPTQAVSQENSIPTTDIQKENGNVKLSLLVTNDVHGKMTNMERIHSIVRQFDQTVPKGTDSVKLSSGDFILGANFISNLVASKMLNWYGVKGNTLGNHEMDVEPAKLAKLLNDASYQLLAINASVEKSSPMYGKIAKSIIYEENGHKYGIIGIAPSDMKERVKLNESVKDIYIDDIDTTIEKVQAEINRLRDEEGINKIIVTSHSGLKNDAKIARSTSGIDIINSAHTHELVNGIKKGKNLLCSKSGEPVILTEYGKDGEFVGVLNVEFDKNGVIVKAQNNTVRTRAFNRTLPIRAAVEDIIGKPEIIGKVSTCPQPPKDRLIEYNPHGGVIVDAMRSELDTDIAVLNSGNIRGQFTPGGEVDSRLINDITPFEDKIWINKLSEKDLVDAIKVGAKSLVSSNHKPGVLYFSGMKYKLNDKGELLSLTYIDKQGKEHPIDVNNPSTERTFMVASDDFFATGGDNYLPTNKNPDFVVKKYDFDKNKLACEYIKKLPQPFEIVDDHRVEIVPSEQGK